MEVVVKLNDFLILLCKVRLVVDLIRGKKVSQVFGILFYQFQVVVLVIKKVLLFVIVNWQNKNEDFKIEDVDLYVKIIMIDGGRMLKRFRFVFQGRVYCVRKCFYYVIIVVDNVSILVSV